MYVYLSKWCIYLSVYPSSQRTYLLPPYLPTHTYSTYLPSYLHPTYPPSIHTFIHASIHPWWYLANRQHLTIRQLDYWSTFLFNAHFFTLCLFQHSKWETPGQACKEKVWHWLLHPGQVPVVCQALLHHAWPPRPSELSGVLSDVNYTGLTLPSVLKLQSRAKLVERLQFQYGKYRLKSSYNNHPSPPNSMLLRFQLVVNYRQSTLSRGRVGTTA